MEHQSGAERADRQEPAVVADSSAAADDAVVRSSAEPQPASTSPVTSGTAPHPVVRTAALLPPPGSTQGSPAYAGLTGSARSTTKTGISRSVRCWYRSYSG